MAQGRPIASMDMRRKKQLVASKAGMNTSSHTDSGGTTVNMDLRFASRIGPVDASNIQMLFANFVGGAPIDVDNANAITVRAALEALDGSKFNSATSFYGQESVLISPKSGGVLSDAIGASFEADKLFAVRTNVQITSGQSAPCSYSTQGGSYLSQDTASSASENIVKNAIATQVYGTGSLSGTLAGSGYRPLAIIGEVDVPCPAVAIVGDSIAEGSGDSVSNNLIVGQAVGYLGRGLRLPNNSILPSANIAKGGQALNGYSTSYQGLDQARRLAVMQYCSDAICHIGTNDLTSTTTLSAMQNAYLLFWSILRRYGVRITQATILPRVSGTYTTAAGQTPVHANFEPGGLRDQLNEWFPSQVASGVIHEVIDPCSTLEDPENPGRWTTTGGIARTSDGVHPNTQGHQDGATVVQAWAVRRMTAFGLSSS